MLTTLQISTGETILKVEYNNAFGNQFDLCNLGQLVQLHKNSEKYGYIKKISRFWNGKFERLSKKTVNELLEANKLTTINY